MNDTPASITYGNKNPKLRIPEHNMGKIDAVDRVVRPLVLRVHGNLRGICDHVD